MNMQHTFEHYEDYKQVAVGSTATQAAVFTIPANDERYGIVIRLRDGGVYMMEDGNEDG